MSKAADNKKEDIFEYAGLTQNIPIQAIDVADFCRRSSYLPEKMDILRQSIEKRGLIQNPVVIDNGDGRFTLVAGSRRFFACKSLGWKQIPCSVKKASSSEAGLLSFAENAVRSMPNPVDQARLLKQIKDNTGLSDKDIGAEVGLPQSGVTERLSILNLGNDILAEIGTLPESPFKLTHAVALSRLARTGRYNRQIEMRELLNKVKQYGLPTSETKDLARLYEDGSYDRLSDSLKMLLTKNRNMTARMAKLFLYPEQFIDGDSSEAESLRRTAGELTREKREQLVQKAVDGRWSDAQIKKTLKKLLCRSNPKSGEKDNVTIFDLSILSVMHQLEESRYRLNNFSAEQVERLTKRCKQLIESLKHFIEATGQSGKNQPEKGGEQT